MTLAIITRERMPNGRWRYCAWVARGLSGLLRLPEARRWAVERGASHVVEQWDGGEAWARGPRGGLRRWWP